MRFFRKCRTQANQRAKRALRTSLWREAANTEAMYTQAFISECRVGEASVSKRTKRARANSLWKKKVSEVSECLLFGSCIFVKLSYVIEGFFT